MDYLGAYQFLFRRPTWPQNLLLCMVAPFVPIAGPMVVLGYHFDIIETLHLRGTSDYPDFDLNRLLHYLKRGAWPFLVRLVVALPLAGVFAILYFVFLIGIMIATVPDSDPSQAPGWLAFGCAALGAALLLELLGNLILLPMVLRAGLMQDFAAGFSWAFIRDFLGRVWLPALLTELFLALTGTALIVAGLALLLVGVRPAAALLRFAWAYLLYELYEEYLRRGGGEVPLQVQPGPAPVRDEE